MRKSQSKAVSAQYGIRCPSCGAAPHEPCRAKSGRVTDTHTARVQAQLHRAPGNLTPEKRADMRASSSHAPWGVWLDIRPEDLTALLDAADELDRLRQEKTKEKNDA